MAHHLDSPYLCTLLQSIDCCCCSGGGESAPTLPLPGSPIGTILHSSAGTRRELCRLIQDPFFHSSYIGFWCLFYSLCVWIFSIFFEWIWKPEWLETRLRQSFWRVCDNENAPHSSVGCDGIVAVAAASSRTTAVAAQKRRWQNVITVFVATWSNQNSPTVVAELAVKMWWYIFEKGMFMSWRVTH